MRGALVGAGLAAALGLRLSLGGEAPAASAPAALVFASALLGVACAAGWRPGAPSLAAAGAGIGGAALLVIPWLGARWGLGPALASPSIPLLLWTPAVTFVAVSEEVVLRGVLFDAIREHGGDWTSLGITTLLFGAIHVPLYGLGALPLDLLVGLVLGCLRILTGGVAAPALAHVLADLAGGWIT